MVRIPTLTIFSEPVEDSVTLLVDGQLYQGWKEVEIAKHLTSLCGSFSLSLTDSWSQDGRAWPLKVGDLVEVYMEEKKVITGSIDRFEIEVEANHRTLTISGRDKTGDLVDCSETTEPGEFRGLNLLQLAQKFSSPFGMEVRAETEDLGEPFNPFTIRQGETVFEALERGARRGGLLLISDAEGNLVITRKNSRRASTELVQGVNILSAQATFDHTERFSEYTVKGQSAGTDDFYGEEISTPLGKAEDRGILRFRPLILIAEGSVDTSLAQKRAEWEATVRAARSARVMITTPGWKQVDGRFWEINETTPIQCPWIGMDQEMLIVSTIFHKSREKGTTTTLELVRPDAFEPEPVIEKKSDPMEKLGIVEELFREVA
ncbi:MAG: hypothetical protein HY538_07505 [Deltaproteobacteria bacterium]|nr:hypothetical protein [Deltaproteobacteria bacterium]